MAKPDSSCIIMYIKSPHSCLYPKWLQRYGIKGYVGGKIGVGGSVLIWKRNIVDKERITTD